MTFTVRIQAEAQLWLAFLIKEAAYQNELFFLIIHCP